MAVGRNKSFRDPVTITLQCERVIHNKIKALRVRESEVYTRGAKAIIALRAHELTIEAQQKRIQEMREEMATIQEEIIRSERILMDSEIKQMKAQKAETTILIDERGRKVTAVYAK